MDRHEFKQIDLIRPSNNIYLFQLYEFPFKLSDSLC